MLTEKGADADSGLVHMRGRGLFFPNMVRLSQGAHHLSRNSTSTDTVYKSPAYVVCLGGNEDGAFTDGTIKYKNGVVFLVCLAAGHILHLTTPPV